MGWFKRKALKNFEKKYTNESTQTEKGFVRKRTSEEGKAATDVVLSLEGQHLIINPLADEIRDIYELFFQVNFFQDILNSKGMFIDKKKYDEVIEKIKNKKINLYTFKEYLKKAYRQSTSLQYELQDLGSTKIDFFEKKEEEILNIEKTISSAQDQIEVAAHNFLKNKELPFEEVKFKIQVITSNEKKLITTFNELINIFISIRKKGETLRPSISPNETEIAKMNDYLTVAEREINIDEVKVYDKKRQALNHLLFLETGIEREVELLAHAKRIGKKNKVSEYLKTQGVVGEEKKHRQGPDARVTREELDKQERKNNAA